MICSKTSLTLCKYMIVRFGLPLIELTHNDFFRFCHFARIPLILR